MTMAGPYWVSVAVLVLMTVNGVTAIDPNQLAPIVQKILNRYTPNYNGADDKSFPPMFSVAVSVPYNEDKYMYDMNEVFDSGEKVRKTILNCDVYKGDRVVAATVLRWPNVLTQCPKGPVQWPDVWQKCRGKPITTWAEVEKFCGIDKIKYAEADHAESRTLQYVNTLAKNKQKTKDDLMVFYVRASPCDQTCTNQENSRNILTKIQDIMKWNNYVVVFSDVFKPDKGNLIRENELRGSLERLGDAIADQGSKVKDKRSNGLQKIFRCYRQPKMNENEMKCLNCNTNGAVARKCVSDV